MKRRRIRARAVAAAAFFLSAAASAAEPLFDAHLHYGAAEAAALAPEEVLERLARNGIDRAIVSSTPNDGSLALYEAAPERILPFISLYRDKNRDKRHWPRDASVIERLEGALENGTYRGIGEFHIFAEDRESEVFRRVVELAREHGLPMQIHGDPAIIDTAFAIAPESTIIWAHAGTKPRPALIEAYLERYPNLYVDTSVRDGRIAPEGRLARAWRRLFLAHPDRFLVGVDTFSPNRWSRVDEVVKEIRGWLAQLPEEVARQIARENGERLFPEQGTQPTASTIAP